MPYTIKVGSTTTALANRMLEHHKILQWLTCHQLIVFTQLNPWTGSVMYTQCYCAHLGTGVSCPFKPQAGWANSGRQNETLRRNVLEAGTWPTGMATHAELEKASSKGELKLFAGIPAFLTGLLPFYQAW